MQTIFTTWRMTSGARWLVHGFYGLSFAVALPLAAFTCNGWLGLMIHGLALSGMASWLDKAGSRLVRSEGGAF